ncbi:MAG: hypothetical protein JWO63_3161 [Frankiales bacterium]|jgi:hypothetical protein|nr:hypothetical protein [Frankiales bacterium]
MDDESRVPPEEWRRLPPARPNPQAAEQRPEIVYLDPHLERPVSQYSPEGEIRMMGDFAAGLTRRRVSRPLAFGLVAVVLIPVVLSVVAVLSNWW